MKAPKLVVKVYRDSLGGDLVSEVMSDPPDFKYSLVIDRAKGRGPCTPDALVARAKKLAEIMNVDYLEDKSWPCQAMRKLACRCPKCVGVTG